MQRLHAIRTEGLRATHTEVSALAAELPVLRERIGIEYRLAEGDVVRKERLRRAKLIVKGAAIIVPAWRPKRTPLPRARLRAIAMMQAIAFIVQRTRGDPATVTPSLVTEDLFCTTA